MFSSFGVGIVVTVTWNETIASPSTIIVPIGMPLTGFTPGRVSPFTMTLFSINVVP
ncbi:hypothetical protein B4120_0951 [Bacillus cereus]|nr:hypothetical protein B4120_0951 [Bacillus cereus]